MHRREQNKPCAEFWPYRENWCGFKTMRHANERRQFFAVDRKYVRGKRRPNYLPNPWDDEFVTRCGVKTWKDAYKAKKQWEKNLRDPKPHYSKVYENKRFDWRCINENLTHHDVLNI